MSERKKEKLISILSVLKSSDRPLSSARIAEELSSLGQDVSERTVRFYLKQMDKTGLTENVGRKGRLITQQGLEELESSRTIDRVGFLSARIDQMTYRMNFDLTSRTGKVIVNVSLADPADIASRTDLICKVFEQGYAMGHVMSLLGPGETLERISVPDKMLGIATVCSITLNGVLLKYGIPTHSRFGGLLELENRKPTRFAEIITYEGSTIDPLEVFIRSGMTNYVGAVTTGNGLIGAGFREFPSASRQLVEELAQQLRKVGLGGFMAVGRPSQSLLDIPVSEGRVGAIVIGGLNPVAILEETGIRASSRAMSGLIDFNRLFHYAELEDRLAPYING